jgi:hypothetical protein
MSFLSVWNTSAAQRLAEARGPDRDDHELLQVQAVVGVGAAVDHVHQRNGELHPPGSAEVAIQRQARFLGRRLGGRQRHRQDGVGPQARLVLGVVQLDHGLVDERLLHRIEPDDRLADLGVDVLDRLEHALAAVALRVAVAQLDRLPAAGGRARRHRRAAEDAGLEQHVGLHRRSPARVENLPRHHIHN